MMESLLKWTFLQLLIAACFKTGVLQNNQITLTSSLEVVLENRSVFLTCSSTTGALSSSHWNTSFYKNQVAQCARTNDNTCFKSHFLNNSALFDCICNDNGSFTVLLKQVNRFQHGSTWNCRNYFETSNAVVINVSVPVKHAILTWSENQPLNENTNVTLTCTTSYCLPSAQIYWHRTYMTSTVEITGRDVEITRKIESAEGNVKKVTEILSYMVNRSVNGWNVYCTATNWRSDEISSVKIVLSVIYQPAKPPVIDGLLNGSTYRVIENEKVSLSCSVEGGNPLAKPEWHCERIITTKERITNNKTVISYLSWMAKRSDGKTCTCKMGHVLSNVSLYVNIDVLYPPGTITLQLEHETERTNVTSDAKLIENRFYRLLCSADANPPSEYIWDAPQISGINNVSLALSDVTRIHKGTYTCHARNTMHSTFGQNVTKENISSISIDVLYKPTLIVIQNQDVVESSSLYITCGVISANPYDIFYNWTRSTGDFHRNSKELIFQNISRHDATNYTCTVKNFMIPTVGKGEEGYASETFFLNVWCTPMAYHHIVKEMRSKLHAPVTLKFRALAYPEPEFTWEKWANTSWHKITNDNMFSISSFELQSTLTIINFTTSTPNVYRLIVENEIGRFIQNYTLKSFDHPETPMDFSYIKELLTDTSVTLLWKPGLNGGIPQTFIIMYKGQKDKDWNNTAIQDTSNTVMNLTVQGLSSDTSYTFQLLAVNGEGSSGIVTLQIKTKHYSGGKQGENSPTVAGIVLGVLSVLVLGTAVPVFIFLRRRYQQTRPMDNKERSYENLPEMRTMSGGKNPAVHEPVYEGLRPDAERRVNEKNEQAYEILQPGHDLDGATNPIYTNLKL